MKFLKNNKFELIVIILLPVVFLYKMIFFGEIVVTNDELERHPINEWSNNYFIENDDIPQWYPNLFSGMPSYGGYIYSNGDPSKYFRKNLLFNTGLRIWFYLVLSGVGMFLLLRYLKISRFSALFGSIISCLTPYSFGLINAGHLTKIFSMAFIPWVILTAIMCINKFNMRSIILLSLATAFQLWMNHPQIAYYTWMVVGFYFLWSLGVNIKSGALSFNTGLYPFIGIICGVVLALFMVSDPYIEIYKFQKHSNRGATSVLDNTGQTNKGTDWDYATQWSFHPKELISLIYPYHFGLQNSSDLDRGAYWGYMPFTQSTHYLGLICIIFAILGALLKTPDRTEYVLWVVTFLTIITGFGSYFSVLYKPFYYALPFFSKFRIPSMIYILLAVTLPILGSIGLDKFINKSNDKNTLRKAIYIVSGIGGLSIILLMFGETLLSFNSPSDFRYRSNPNVLKQLYNARVSLFNKGLFLNIAFISGVAILIWSFISKKINKVFFSYLLLSLTILDLWIINSEFMNTKPAMNMDRQFKETPVITYLKNTQENFRVYPKDKALFKSNYFSYWNIESIGGYRPIKLRNYQDLLDAIERTGGFENPKNQKVLDMLNVKYIFSRNVIKDPAFLNVENIPGLYENNNALPRAWLVGKVKTVESQRESLMEVLLGNFDPKTQAIVVGYNGNDYLNQNVSGDINIISFNENRIELSVSSKTGGLLVLSEIYYKPGWKATLSDGIGNEKELPIYQTNHVLRSVNVPIGNSKVTFEYDNTSWEKTRILSRLSFFFILAILGSLYWKEKE